MPKTIDSYIMEAKTQWKVTVEYENHRDYEQYVWTGPNRHVVMYRYKPGKKWEAGVKDQAGKTVFAPYTTKAMVADWCLTYVVDGI